MVGSVPQRIDVTMFVRLVQKFGPFNDVMTNVSVETMLLEDLNCCMFRTVCVFFVGPLSVAQFCFSVAGDQELVRPVRCHRNCLAPNSLLLLFLLSSRNPLIAPSPLVTNVVRSRPKFPPSLARATRLRKRSNGEIQSWFHGKIARDAHSIARTYAAFFNFCVCWSNRAALRCSHASRRMLLAFAVLLHDS